MDHLVEAMRCAGWTPKQLKRRLDLFKKRGRGVPMTTIIEESGHSEKTAYRDWVAIRKVLNAAAAPELSYIRAKLDVRLEHIYMLAMTDVARALNRGQPIPSAMLREARHALIAIGEIYGAIDRRGLVVIPGQRTLAQDLATKTTAELNALLIEEARALSKILPDALVAMTPELTNGHEQP